MNGVTLKQLREMSTPALNALRLALTPMHGEDSRRNESILEAIDAEYDSRLPMQDESGDEG